MDSKGCIECGEKITGRVDKKFCSDLCRNAYNNSRSRDKNNLMRKVNGILRKNRSILESHNPHGKGKVSKEKLLKEGFDFSYYTNVYTTKAGKQYFFCYEQGYLPIENDYLALVIKKEYID